MQPNHSIQLPLLAATGRSHPLSGLFSKLIAVAALCVSLTASAATSITTPFVSGHWTLAGSPYKVYNDIGVDNGASLVIDPGVQVIFQGPYALYVLGSMNAVGTPSQRITFTMGDTTGFTTDRIGNRGGWHGIQYEMYTGSTPDSSALKYCDITYCKYDSADASLPHVGTLSVSRSLKVHHCNIAYCNANLNTSISFGAFGTYTQPGELVDMDSCSIHDHNVGGFLLSVGTVGNGRTSISNSTIYNNPRTASVVYVALANIDLVNNEIYNNGHPTASGYGIITIFGNHAFIWGNVIHDNVSEMDAVVFCAGGFVDILYNYICNNHHVSGTCGLADGGGAISLMQNSPVPPDSTYYVVKNNVIANNYSPFHGGAINVMTASALIANNDIVNNQSVTGAAIFLNSITPSNNVKIKNNLFYGNREDTGTMYTSPDIQGRFTATVSYEHNWSLHNATFNLASLVAAGGVTIVGDTTTNILGSNPRLILPTTTSSYTESALTANFALTPLSGCIDQGDSTGAQLGIIDMLGLPRIQNLIVDIGAYEYSSFYYPLAAPAITKPAARVDIYPNPASTVVNIGSDDIITKVEVTNILGATIYKAECNSRHTQIDVAGFAAGTYMIRVNGAQAYKFVKQ